MRDINPEQLIAAAPETLRTIMTTLHTAGCGVWIVGGAIRDWLFNSRPHDWDLATTASPENVLALFPRVIPVGLSHGTVKIHTPELDVEITVCPPGPATNPRILADLARRDFTINAMAVQYPSGSWLDPHGGVRDLAARRLRAVGDAGERFREDPLRTLRAARLASTWGFRLTATTYSAMRGEVPGLSMVACERIRDEMLKLLTGPHVLEAFSLLRRAGILKIILPELLEGVRKRQNAYHRHDVYHHTLYTVHHSPPRTRVRLAALLHDIGKPRVRRRSRGAFHFHGHAKVGAAMAQEILTRWKMPLRLTEQIRILIANHMLLDIERWSDAAVRRLMVRVGQDLLDDLLDLAEADHLAHGTEIAGSPVGSLRRRIAQQLHQRPALHITDLAIDGHDVMRTLALPPGPEVGQVLKSLQRKVLKRPELNQRSTLLAMLSQNEY